MEIKIKNIKNAVSCLLFLTELMANVIRKKCAERQQFIQFYYCSNSGFGFVKTSDFYTMILSSGELSSTRFTVSVVVLWLIQHLQLSKNLSVFKTKNNWKHWSIWIFWYTRRFTLPCLHSYLPTHLSSKTDFVTFAKHVFWALLWSNIYTKYF